MYLVITCGAGHSPRLARRATHDPFRGCAGVEEEILRTTRHVDAMRSTPHERLRNKNSRVVHDVARHEVDCQAKLAREWRVFMKRHRARALVQVGVGLKYDSAHNRDVFFLIMLKDGGELNVEAILDEHSFVVNRRD